MQPYEIFLTAVPIIFAGGGIYAVFRWRINKVEKALEKMADMCITNRQACNEELGLKLDQIRKEMQANNINSIAERKELQKDVVQLMVLVARLDQKILNGNHQETLQGL